MRTTVGRRLTAVAVAAVSVLTAAPATGTPRRGGYSKVMVITEENRTYAEIVGGPEAPYLTRLARTYGSATRMVANYPVSCPSLAAYILMTSGSTAGICDDRGPKHHPLSGANIFAQLDAAHLPWRNYAENLPAPCARKNSADGLFLVRHTPVPYYNSESRVCATGQADLGTPTGGALHDDVRTGRLPSYAFVTPNTCHDMHGAPTCPGRRIVDGDQWLARWLPQILAGPDYRAGRLVIIITWDEGSPSSNHIPTLVVSPSTHAVSSAQAYDHCSTLRTAEDILRLAPLACARSAASMTGDFRL
jgi:hypothetical protein